MRSFIYMRNQAQYYLIHQIFQLTFSTQNDVQSFHLEYLTVCDRIKSSLIEIKTMKKIFLFFIMVSLNIDIYIYIYKCLKQIDDERLLSITQTQCNLYAMMKECAQLITTNEERNKTLCLFTSIISNIITKIQPKKGKMLLL